MILFNRLVAFLGGLGLLLLAEPLCAQSEMDLMVEDNSQESPTLIDDTINPNLTLHENLSAENTSASDVEKTAEQPQDNTDVADISTDENNNQEENWLQSLISKGKSSFFGESEFEEESDYYDDEDKSELVQNVLSQRSNVAFFDISGVRLRMTPEEVNKILTEQGYRQILQNQEVPNFIKWRSEEICRVNGVFGFERLNACAMQIALENGYGFVEREVYNRYSSKESIEVYYTSSFTGNLSHRIHYKSSVTLSDSKASKNVYLNNLKIYDFWKRIDMKYGAPDNTSEVKWGLGGKKPYLKAQTGMLELVDPILKDLDMARMFNEDTRMANSQYYTF